MVAANCTGTSPSIAAAVSEVVTNRTSVEPYPRAMTRNR